MRIVYFTHSLLSCWNHGNAHFLRGVLRQLARRGHEVRIYEPEGAWSLRSLMADHGEAGLEPFRAAYPELSSALLTGVPGELEAACDGADLVVVHEWNDPAIVAEIGRLRRQGRFTLLFHDNHHRAVSEPEAINAFDLRNYDGVLAFGETLADVYRRWGWGGRVFVWHEAADVDLFRPPADEAAREGLVWIGNWGDGERTAELEHFLMAPARAAELSLDIYGVRYPPEALAMLARHGARYRGWLANARAPEIFARHLATVHVPRRFYVEHLPGIPTIRVFEALACGIPLVSAPWRDSESLFRAGRDFLFAANGTQMEAHLRHLANEPALGAELARSGIETIMKSHTCGHRADELLAIAARVGTPALEAVS